MKPYPGTYYWSVQAVDEGLASSAFSAEESISTTGMSDVQNEYLNIYPNPLTEDALNIQNINEGDIEIIVTETSGKIIWSRVIRHPGSSLEIELPLDHGIYFVRMRQGNTVVCRKVVK